MIDLAMTRRRRRVGLGLASALAAGACALDVAPIPPPRLDGAVGLEIAVVNGEGSGLTLLPGHRLYVNHLRFQVHEKQFPAPDVLEWLQAESELAELDWSGTTRVRTEWSRGSDGTYQELRPYLHAAWMRDVPEFRLEFRDAGGAVTAGPIVLDTNGFVIARQTAIGWVSGEPAPGEYGENSGSYPELAVTSAGTFSGPGDDIYSIQVVTAGPADGTAVVDIASVRGDARTGVAVQSGVPIALGAAGYGATITFTDGGTPPTELVAGDRWIVRCAAGEAAAVGAAEPGTRATFSAVAEIRLQYPRAQLADVFELPATTTELLVTWSGRPDRPYVVPVAFAAADPARSGYGLGVSLRVSPPAAGGRYAPGETIEVAVDLADGAGLPLHAEGALPTYRAFIDGASNGILYYRGTDPSGGFFTEDRLNLMRLTVFGPKHLVRETYTGGEPEGWYVHEVNLPDVASVIYAGAWDTPLANMASFELPADAPPGTYVASAKVARSWFGQTIYLEEHVELQVGSLEPTEFAGGVGNCEVCHTVDARLARLRHGIASGSPKYCDSCHKPPRATAGVIVHRVHFYSSIYPVRKSGCSLCHLTPESNTRSSVALCGSCHGEIHVGESIVLADDPYAECGETCHDPLPEVHAVPRTY